MTIEELEGKVQEARERLEALRAEQGAPVGDYREILQRKADLPHEILIAQIELYEATKRQGRRTDLTCGKNYHKLKTAEDIAEQYGVEDAAEQSKALKVATQEAYERVEQARREYWEAEQAYVRANNQMHSVIIEIGQLRMERDKLLIQHRLPIGK